MAHKRKEKRRQVADVHLKHFQEEVAEMVDGGALTTRKLEAAVKRLGKGVGLNGRRKKAPEPEPKPKRRRRRRVQE